ncbi:MAG: hypothetical protein ACK5IJ_05940 [Mangrovibacterium sp.]
MKVKDLFHVIVKIVGIIIVLFDPYQVVINLLSEIFRPDREGYIISFLLLSLMTIYFIAYHLVFKTKRCVELLNLGNLGAKDIAGINQRDLFTVSLYFVGLLLVMINITTILVDSAYLFKGQSDNDFMSTLPPTIKRDFILGLFDLIVGVMIIINVKSIVKLVQPSDQR